MSEESDSERPTAKQPEVPVQAIQPYLDGGTLASAWFDEAPNASSDAQGSLRWNFQRGERTGQLQHSGSKGDLSRH